MNPIAKCSPWKLERLRPREQPQEGAGSTSVERILLEVYSPQGAQEQSVRLSLQADREQKPVVLERKLPTSQAFAFYTGESLRFPSAKILTGTSSDGQVKQSLLASEPIPARTWEVSLEGSVVAQGGEYDEFGAWKTPRFQLVTDPSLDGRQFHRLGVSEGPGKVEKAPHAADQMGFMADLCLALVAKATPIHQAVPILRSLIDQLGVQKFTYPSSGGDFFVSLPGTELALPLRRNQNGTLHFADGGPKMTAQERNCLESDLQGTPFGRNQDGGRKERLEGLKQELILSENVTNGQLARFQ